MRRKDPNMPERARSAFMIFAEEVRPEIGKENPQMSFSEIAKEMGRWWRNFSNEDREYFVKRAAEEKETYEKEMKIYLEKEASNENSKKTTIKMAKNNNKSMVPASSSKQKTKLSVAANRTQFMTDFDETLRKYQNGVVNMTKEQIEEINDFTQKWTQQLGKTDAVIIEDENSAEEIKKQVMAIFSYWHVEYTKACHDLGILVETSIAAPE